MRNLSVVVVVLLVLASATSVNAIDRVAVLAFSPSDPGSDTFLGRIVRALERLIQKVTVQKSDWLRPPDPNNPGG